MTPSTRESLQQLAVTVLLAAVVASLCLAYAYGVRSQMAAEIPAQEVEMPEAKDFDAAWDGIPTPPFTQKKGAP